MSCVHSEKIKHKAREVCSSLKRSSPPSKSDSSSTDHGASGSRSGFYGVRLTKNRSGSTTISCSIQIANKTITLGSSFSSCEEAAWSFDGAAAVCNAKQTANSKQRQCNFADASSRMENEAWATAYARGAALMRAARGQLRVPQPPDHQPLAQRSLFKLQKHLSFRPLSQLKRHNPKVPS